MKFQLVEFYPIETPKSKKKSKRVVIGTVHLYLIDIQLDIRGIKVSQDGKKIFFHFPHLCAIDSDTKELVRYPVFRFADNKIHEEMLDFLFKQVKPIILEKLNDKRSK